jgi:type IV pilus modification protein PilV
MNKKQEAGFTLVELLVALLILSVGILGIVTLQTKNISYADSVARRNQAISLANEYISIINMYATTDDVFDNTTGAINATGCFMKSLGNDFSKCNNKKASDALGVWKNKTRRLYGAKNININIGLIDISPIRNAGVNDMARIFICFPTDLLQENDGNTAITDIGSVDKPGKACALSNYQVVFRVARG